MGATWWGWAAGITPIRGLRKPFYWTPAPRKSNRRHRKSPSNRAHNANAERTTRMPPARMPVNRDSLALTSAISSRREHTPQAPHSPKTPAPTPPKHHQHPLKHTPTLTTETHTTNATPHLQPNTTPHRDFSALHPHTPRDPITRHLLPIARAEFTIAPLLQVPPASRGEPRTGSVPPARRGNLKEGGFNRACFCKLWSPRLVSVFALVNMPPSQRGRGRSHGSLPARAMFKSHCKDAYQRPVHPRTPRHTPLPAVKTPTRLLPQPKTALHPTKPHLHLPTLPQLQQQHLQRHRQLPPVRAVRNRVHPKRHRLARLAPLGALGMPTHDNHEKHPRAPPHPTTRTFNPHPQVQLHAPAPQAAPVASPRAVATCLVVSTLGRSTPADAPDPKAPPAAGRTSASPCACAHSRPCAAHSSLPNALVSPRPSPTHSSSCSGRPAALSHARTRCRLAIQPCYFGAARGGVGVAGVLGEKVGSQSMGTQRASGWLSSQPAITKRWALRSPRANGALAGLGVQWAPGMEAPVRGTVVPSRATQ
jgi:hypothetical protein